MGRSAKQAASGMASLDPALKNRALRAIAGRLRARAEEIYSANARDLEASSCESAPLLKRLRFDSRKLEECIAGIESLALLPEPVGITQKATELDRGLELFRVSCPIGVIGVIFESRPDALVQISTLCLKSGNAVLLKGGREALNTNRVLTDILDEACAESGMPSGWLQLLETREDVRGMLTLDTCIDLIIPRGSNAFVKYIMDNTNIPVMGHAEGLCHLYVDTEADVEMAVRIAVDSKCQYVSVCNAMETLLVHRDIAGAFLPRAAAALKAAGARLRGCPQSCRLVKMEPADDSDWDTEYLDYVLSVRVVDSLQEAVTHINTHGSRHTDAIVSANPATAARFTALVDSADVFWNCSTRFADGYRFGLGAEVGISTGKLHARGPVGLDGLCTYKWILCGHGQIVADYAEGRSHFTHRPLNMTCREAFENGGTPK